MRRFTWFVPVAVAGLVTIIGLSSCATVNQLRDRDFSGKPISLDLVPPPSAEINVGYEVHVDMNRPVLTFINVGTNLAKANQAAQARERLERALSTVNIPEIFAGDVYSETLGTLGAVAASPIPGTVDTAKGGASSGTGSAAGAGSAPSPGSDYILRIEIFRYGIDATRSGDVSFVVASEARLYDERSRELVWGRRFERREAVSPDTFGLGGSVANIVTTSVLADLTEQQMTDGLSSLARSAAHDVSARFSRDLYRARYDQ